MTNQMDHHYIPQFFLKNWENNKKIYRYFKNIKGQIIEDRKPSQSIGFKINLYTLNKGTFLPIHDAQIIETEFFKKLDSDCALILVKMMTDNGINTLNNEERITWAKFIHALMERIPKEIDNKKVATNQIGNEYLEDFPSEGLKNGLIIKDLGKEIFTEEFLQNESFGLLIRVIDDPHWNHWFCNTFEWKLVALPDNASFFISSDNPIIKNYGMNSNATFSIGLAISPNVLFLAYERGFAMSDDLLVKLILLHNLEIIKQSDCFVFSKYSLDDKSIIKYKKAMTDSLRPIIPQEFNKK